MKRYVKPVPIYAMASSRSDAIKRLESMKPDLESHIFRLGTYDDQFQCKNHWINEIATYLDRANKITIRSGSGKLDSRTYVDHLVGGIGDTVEDAEVNALYFRNENRREKQYPDFNPEDNKIIQGIYNVSCAVLDLVQNVLPTKNKFQKADFYYYIQNRV